MQSIRRLLTQGVNTGTCHTDSWKKVSDTRHTTFFRLRSVDGRLDQRITKADMRHSSITAFKYALGLLNDNSAGLRVYWSDSMMVHIKHKPENCPLCFCAETYRADDGKVYVKVCYFDESGVMRMIRPDKLLAHFNRR